MANINKVKSLNKNLFVNESLLSDILSVSKRTIKLWRKNKTLYSTNDNKYNLLELQHFDNVKNLLNSNWDKEISEVPKRPYKSIELFCGAGGLAIGLENAGFKNILLNEIDKSACKTLKYNRPNWNLIENDIAKIGFEEYFNEIDLLSGGFPCQAFSYAGKKMGFEDTRGTLFFEYARAIKEIKPKIFLAENVKGLLNHDNGKTLKTIKQVLKDLGYFILKPRVLNAMFYKVPQKRKRLIIIGIRNDLVKYSDFKWPSTYYRVLTLNDALFEGELYDCDCPKSEGQNYSKYKKHILSKVPQGGYWKDLPIELQKKYMKKSFYNSGGKTGMARRLSLSNPSLTLTCSPSQKQTERCHPLETRPLSIREYARIQTFPDEWHFEGSISSKYRQIGNAVPINLATAISKRLIGLLNSIEDKKELNILNKKKGKKQEQLKLRL